MLSWIPLPIVWLGCWLVGQLTAERRAARCATAAAISLAVVLPLWPWHSWALWLALGLAVVGWAHVVARAKSPLARRWLVGTAVVGLVALIVAYLGVRPYVQKFFPYLPSLSYLGFRAIDYVVTAGRRQQPLAAAGLMQMFFLPLVFLGPISRVENFTIDWWDYRDVLRRLALGFSQLTLGYLAGGYVLENVSYGPRLPMTQYWIGAVANSLELYFTFAGYSHLIIGLGLLVGFRLPDNFNNPYLATSIGEFWRRWHMSLSFWIRDYIYIPLGGNRLGLARKCANMLITMALCGLWHGLSAHYLAWGLLHGGLLAWESILKHWQLAPLDRLPTAARRPARVAVTFALVTFGWLLFRYSLKDCGVFLQGMFGW